MATDPPVPLIVIDDREPNDTDVGRNDGNPLPFTCDTVVEHMDTGDYTIKGLEHLFSIERKTIPDIVSCTAGKSRERFVRELFRLRGMRFSKVLIIGEKSDLESGNYRSNAKVVSVCNSLRQFDARYGEVGFVFVKNEQRAAAAIEEWARWFARDIARTYGDMVKYSPECG